MFFKAKKTILNRALDSYATLFSGWDKETIKDDCIDEVIFQKDLIKIVFQEDLKEHIVNLYVYHPQYKIGKIYYRELFLDENLIGIDSLRQSLLKIKNYNNVEKEEVEIYIEFLKTNKIL